MFFFCPSQPLESAQHCPRQTPPKGSRPGSQLQGLAVQGNPGQGGRGGRGRQGLLGSTHHLTPVCLLVESHRPSYSSMSFGGKSQDGVTPPSCFSPTPEKSKGNHRSGERRGWCINFSTSQPSTAEVTVWVCPSPQGEQQGCGDSSDSTPPARGPQGQPPVV